MAPEVLRRTKEDVIVRYTAAADVYSFGTLLWELTHSQVFFAGYPGLQVGCNLVQRRQRPPLSLPDDLARLEPLIASCWHQLPAQRPAMSDCADSLGLLREEFHEAADEGSLAELSLMQDGQR